MINIASPLTNTNDVSLLRTIQSGQLIRDWLRSYQIDITDELHGHKEIYLYQCNQTKLKFFVPFDIAGSEYLYKQLGNKFDWYYMPDKWEHQVALKNLSDCMHILEIGCAFGSFVKAGVDNGFNIRGIELNEAAVKVAQAQNLPVECTDFHEFSELNPQSVDAICSFQVLEHVVNPRRFIESSLRILKPNGKCIFSVPNLDGYLKFNPSDLLGMPPHHMTWWSECSFRALEELYPIKIESVIKEPLSSYHVPGYLSAYRNHFRSITPFANLFFNEYTLPAYQKIMNAGFERFFNGHSLYVQFRKV